MSQIMKNCRAMEAKFSNIFKNRSKFPFGQMHPKAVDPESQIKHRKELTTREVSLSVMDKVQRLKDETAENLQKVKEEHRRRLQSIQTPNEDALGKTGVAPTEINSPKELPMPISQTPIRART